MNVWRGVRLTSRELAALLLWLVATLFLKAWIATTLDARLGDRSQATNLARLVALPLLFAGACLIVRHRQRVLRQLIRPPIPDRGVLLTAVLVGVLMRMIWWSQATARVSFGLTATVNEHPDTVFSAAFDCPPAGVIGVAIIVWLVIVPITEEFVHRGLILSTFADRGPIVAIGLSSLLFAAVHPLSALAFAFLAGIVFGLQFWQARSLVPPVVTHATYDGLQIVDWLCLEIVWLPASNALPLWSTGVVAAIVGVSTLAGVFALLERTGRRRAAPPPCPDRD